MADYGHDLEFGAFITPQSGRPEEVVALAELSERAGLELATFQDHPYQPTFLDTWTLLSWVAARTEALRVSPNVLNLPLRQPAVLARAAASLDLLSGGRLELGIGAGAFWDAIEAMGGRRLTPGQAVDALAEAIDAIRAIWDDGERGGVRLEGEHYAIRGAKRGPAPAHDVSLWIGAYKPRMLRLTGRKGDGWLPSLAYISRQELGPASATIDEAAREAGRDPSEIRRLLNVPAGIGVEELLPLALEHGFSTFIVAGDEPGEIERFGGEVAPALRAAVVRERGDSGNGNSGGGGSERSPKALALRREGIRYEDVPASLAKRAVEPGDGEYRRVRSSYVWSGSPGLVLRPENAEQVAEALAFARAQDVPLAVRSGGHGISGRSTNDGGIVIDLGALDAVEVLDPDAGRFRAGPGARWGEVALALAPHGLAISSGDYGDVGVGGLATAGGVGFLVRRQGLTIDRVKAVDVVLADGTLARAGAEADPDLLWAMRGAGGNFGIATSFELEASPLGEVVFSQAALTLDAQALAAWGAALEAAPRELTSFLTAVDRGGEVLAQLHSVYAGEDPSAAAAALAPLLEAGRVLDQRSASVPYPALVPAHRGTHVGGGNGAFRAGLLDRMTPEAADALVGLLRSGTTPLMQVRSVGGAVNDVPADATAYAHRSQSFSVNAVGRGRERLDERWDAEIAPHLNGLYLSFDADRRPERLHDAFPGETLSQLRELKARYDPDNVFDRNFPIPPAPSGEPPAAGSPRRAASAAPA